MATTTSSPSPTMRRSRWPRILLALVLLVVVVAAGIFFWAYSIAYRALPQLDGRIALPGLSAPVKVTRDGHGVPTLDAANLPDLFFAQGFVTAQDRLWQMDVMRRFAAGELSEILGTEFVPHDREQRILQLRAAAQRSLDLSSAESRACFEAYARGINAYIERSRAHLPIEFRILQYSPRPWTALDSSLIATQMVKDLNHGPYKDALTREKVLAKLGPELTADLYTNRSWRDRPPTAASQKLGDQKNTDGDDEDDEEQLEDPSPTNITSLPQPPAELTDPRLVVGSNNWVVAGSHTITGKPLLSNDMHLGHQMPNLWYEAHLRSGALDVAGVSLPGMPYIVVGHNARIAWGFTNIGPTVEDVYVETMNAQGQYQTPQGWKDPERRHEVIHVKKAPDVTLDVVITRHGPIITSLVPGETRPLALRWTLYAGSRNPLLDVDRAQNWNQFRQAFANFDAPGQNVVYADVDGNIGYQATGRIPIRAAGDGSLPVNGSDDLHEWTGYIPFEKLPSIFNPASGMIATANGRITPDGYAQSISTGWEAPWRTARIYRVLGSGKKFSSADMLALQTDIYSEWDAYVAERLVYSVDHAAHSSARAQQAVEILRNWDGRMSAGSAAPTIAYRSRQELARLLLMPKLGAPPADAAKDSESGALSWKSYQWPMQSVWLEGVLQHQPARWLPAQYPSYDDLLAAAVDAAVSRPEVPSDLKKWTWGEANPVAIQHPILGRIPLLERWSGPGTQPQSGSGYTVKAVTGHHGPSERMTVDLAALDQSTLNLVTGEAGNFLSPYYMDQWKAWYEGFTFALPFSEAAIEKSRTHQLTIEPGSGAN